MAGREAGVGFSRCRQVRGKLGLQGTDRSSIVLVEWVHETWKSISSVAQKTFTYENENCSGGKNSFKNQKPFQEVWVRAYEAYKWLENNLSVLNALKRNFGYVYHVDFEGIYELNTLYILELNGLVVLSYWYPIKGISSLSIEKVQHM